MPIADNIRRVQSDIDMSCRRAARSRESVRLMAVSKTHPAAAILEAFAAGVRLFGENRVQEFAGKKQVLVSSGLYRAEPPVAVHCIGPLQSNKVARGVELFNGIDTVDSLKLAERLNQAVAKAGRVISILIEVKTSPEAEKHGIEPGSPELSQLLDHLPELSHLRPCGLMTVPPYTDDPEQARPYFRRLRELRDLLSQQHPRLQLNELSMGMSHDFPVAIEEGATVVRVGTAIFGARPAA